MLDKEWIANKYAHEIQRYLKHLNGHTQRHDEVFLREVESHLPHNIAVRYSRQDWREEFMGRVAFLARMGQRFHWHSDPDVKDAIEGCVEQLRRTQGQKHNWLIEGF